MRLRLSLQDPEHMPGLKCPSGSRTPGPEGEGAQLTYADILTSVMRYQV